MSDTLWKREAATAAKHDLYARYLDQWWPKVLQYQGHDGHQYERVTYVDAFAGPGEYEGGEDGSPVIALRRLLEHDAFERMRVTRNRVRVILIEQRTDRVNHLREVLVNRFGPVERLPIDVTICHGTAASDTLPMLDQANAWNQPLLAVFDSWGNVNVPLPLLRRIGHSRSGETIVTFGPNWFNRRGDIDTDQLDVVFGGREHWQPADEQTDPEERWRAWLNTYRSALRRAGFEHQLRFEVKPATGIPLYLLFGTKHPKGVAAMKDAMWQVDRTDGLRFRDPRTRGAQLPGQLTLESATARPPAELLELVYQRLSEGPVTLAELGRWVLLETAQWRGAQDARRAVRQLIDDRTIPTPDGRLSKTTVIALPPARAS